MMACRHNVLLFSYFTKLTHTWRLFTFFDIVTVLDPIHINGMKDSFSFIKLAPVGLEFIWQGNAVGREDGCLTLLWYGDLVYVKCIRNDMPGGLVIELVNHSRRQKSDQASDD